MIKRPGLLASRARRVSVVLSLLALSGGMAYLLARTESVAVASGRWLPIQSQTLENRLGLAGRIEPATRLTLTAPFEASIRAIAVTGGQRVAAGHVLLSLDTALLDMQLRQALAELLKARRAVEEMENWPHGDEVARARRAVTHAEMNLNDTQAKLSDTRRLFERGIVARMEVDSLEQQIKLQTLDLTVSRAELRAVQNRGQGESRQIAEMELANAQARYDGLMTRKHQGEVSAPFAGIVLPRPRSEGGSEAAPIQPGARVALGAPLFELVSQERIQAIASVEEADLHQLREGMPVEITGEGFKGLTLRGHIVRLGTQGASIDRYRGGTAYEVLVAIEPLSPAQQQQVRLGMSAQLSIVTYRAEGFALPAEALQCDEGGSYFVVHRRSVDAPPAKLAVKTGHAVPQGVEVFGIEAGFVELSGHCAGRPYEP